MDTITTETVQILGFGSRIRYLIIAISNILLPGLVILGIILIIKAGYSMMTSQGNPDTLRNAKEDLSAAIIGLLFVLLSGTIINIVLNSLGLA